MIEEPPLLTIASNRRRPTAAQIAAFQGVPTSFLADAMGGGGALDARIRPLGEGRDLPVAMAGPALTAGCGPADILALFGALAYVSPGDVVVAAFAGHQGCAAAGDRVCGMLRNGGAAGFLTDGPVRDYEGIAAVGLPVWCTGMSPGSPYTKGPGAIGLPVQIGGLEVETGDMIVADTTGVVVVPYERIDEVIAKLDAIRTQEAALDAKVADGLVVPGWVRALLDSDAARTI